MNLQNICEEETAFYKNKKLHREDGPALIVSNGNENYYLFGIRMSKDEVANFPRNEAGELHTEVPFIVYATGKQILKILYVLNGKEVEKEIFEKYLLNKKLPLNNKLKTIKV